LWALAGGGLSACRSQADREVGLEVTRVAHLVNQLREAPNAAKALNLEALQNASCVHPEVCQLQQVCAQAYALEAKALGVASNVRAALSAGSGSRLGAAQLLDSSERELEHAHQLMLRCVELQAELERAFVAKR
jgi:hypothetical protein